jgi:hypothetical protein
MAEELMPQSEDVYPMIEVIMSNGEPIWQVCGGGICTRHRSGASALELFYVKCQSKGLTLPQ